VLEIASSLHPHVIVIFMAALLHGVAWGCSSVAWGCLSHASYRNPSLDIKFTSEDVSVAAGFVFCSSLLLSLESGSPDIAWFASRSLDIHQDQVLVPYKS
jgi:hypothetical protein